MPIPSKGKLGQDFSRIQNHLDGSGVSKDNHQLYQAIKELIDSSKTLQGFIDDRFPQLDGSDSSLFNFVTDVIEEITDRNNSKYSLSLVNSKAQIVQSGVLTKLTFDTSLFDDGLMFDIDNNIDKTDVILNSNGQWLVTIRCVCEK